jgi:hypothetical protein
MGSKQKPMMDDVGILYSNDIVAIDKASLDLVNEFSKNKFNKINDVNKENQLTFAKKLKLGETSYNLIKL